jgi:hypothetical protein
MLKLTFSILTLLLVSQMDAAHSSIAFAQSSSDACHVYLIDHDAAQRASDEYDKATTDEQRAKAISGGVKILGEFSPKVGEEELTTKTYTIPGSNSVITASVFYTDEMMASATAAESVLLGIAVAGKAQENAFDVPNNAVAEVTYNDFTDAVRVKTNVKIKGRSFLVGLQCNHQQRPPRK